MAALPEARKFAAGIQSVRGEEPLLIGLIGPPGGGKTVSALRLATGMRAVRSGPVVLIDTEGGRSRKYSPDQNGKPDPSTLKFDFLRVDFPPPFRSHDFLACIKAQMDLKPAAIIVDCMSDEHEGEGAYLEWHDSIAQAKKGEPGYVGGNEWAAWAMPKAARKRLLSGLLQIKVPLLFTFRAREKTKTEPGKGGGRDQIVNIGWMPVAPLEIVHSLDLTCILPPRANGVPVWTSEKIGEDFIVKLPAFLAPLIQKGQLSEATGAALARWAKGEPTGPVQIPGSDLKPPPGAPADLWPANLLDGKEAEIVRRKGVLDDIGALLTKHCGSDKAKRGDALQSAFGTPDRVAVSKMETGALEVGLDTLRRQLDGLAAMAAEREPGEDPEEA
jgi:hypothetical protein